MSVYILIDLPCYFPQYHTVPHIACVRSPLKQIIEQRTVSLIFFIETAVFDKRGTLSGLACKRRDLGGRCVAVCDKIKSGKHSLEDEISL